DILRIEAEFTREEIDRWRVAPADISPKVDVDSLLVESPSPTPASKPSELVSSNAYFVSISNESPYISGIWSLRENMDTT
ncbi:hypothetical protein H5410_031666, partial [Solanum commersonii]